MSVENMALSLKRKMYEEISKLNSLFEWGKCIVDGKPILKIETTFEYNEDTEAVVITITDTGEGYGLNVTSTLSELEETLIDMCDDIPEILNNKRETMGENQIHPACFEKHLETLLSKLETNLSLEAAVSSTLTRGGFKHVEIIEYDDNIKTLACLEFTPEMKQPVLTIYSDIVTLNAIKIDKSHLTD